MCLTAVGRLPHCECTEDKSINTHVMRRRFNANRGIEEKWPASYCTEKTFGERPARSWRSISRESGATEAATTTSALLCTGIFPAGGEIG